MINRRQLCSTLLAAPFVATAGAAHAQAFPNRPIRLVVPYAAGGGTDALARVVAQAMSERLGQTVMVENIAGAGGNLATQTVASAPPDGYTMLMANQGPIAVNPHLFKSLKINPVEAFAPVTLIAAAPLLLVVPAKSEFTSVEQLIAYAKANPRKLTYGSAGNGSASHLAVVLFNVVTGIEAIHVPYKGAGPALNDLLGAQTQFMITTIPSVTGLVDSGQLRALAVSSKVRSPTNPDVPTVAERGWPAYDSRAWYGFVVPKGTPRPIVDTLRKATVEAINLPAAAQRMATEGASPIGNTPEEFGAFIKEETDRWAEIVKTAGISIN
jgi:tripartite-type tricarboxylate transporter receptor subunit TctC